ncbi:hypothetical protein ACFFV7_50850 [Nonomuraea spiralis]|uniref:Uncharacterized protein n=1 Tax=Nonomuraea spiralis TaxID=46182 RepID=A0ABV5J039_9ACTN|nr:hypothetical protein [Nonomuraea spiralis]GGS88658.1 hypothetical protein GCM10010176_035560 [Nonomuraea spiralis]
MIGLRYILDDWAPDMDSWSWQINVDNEGNWRLTQHGLRRTRTPWRPANEMDAYAVVVILYELNQAGEVPIPDAIAAKTDKADQDALLLNFQTQGFGILLRHLLR